MKKLLILNGSHSDLPLIEAGRKLGFYVITTGSEPTLIGHSKAHEYHSADFSDHHAVLQLAQSLKIDAVCSCANDFGALTAAFVAEQMGLPGHDSWQTALTLHHKDRYRQFAQEIGVPSPAAVSFTDINDALTPPMALPVIVKPVDLTGGKGVTQVTCADEYQLAVKHAFATSRCKRIVVEEFLPGTLHSLTTFLRNRQVIFHFCDNEYSFQNPYLVSTSAGPATDFSAVASDLFAAAQNVAENLQLVDGVLHMQYIMTNRSAKIIEITRRCSGDLYPSPVQRATGVPWAEWIVRAECGMDTAEFPKAQQQGFVGRHCIMASRNGIVRNVRIAAELQPCICDQLLWWTPGYRIDNHLVQKLGILQLQYESLQQMLLMTQRINDLVQVELE